MAFTAPILTELINAELHRVKIVCAKLHLNPSCNMKITAKNLCTPLRKGRQSLPDFHETHGGPKTVCKSFYTGFHENPTKGFVTDTSLRTDR